MCSGNRYREKRKGQREERRDGEREKKKEETLKESSRIPESKSSLFQPGGEDAFWGAVSVHF